MSVQAHELTTDYKYGFHDKDISVFRTEKGLSPEVVAAISDHKSEPEWMLKFRLKALAHFRKRPMPTWGADLSGIDFDNIYYYVKPVEEQSRSWDDVPDSIKNTFDKLGIPEAERKFLAGVSAQYDSEVVYHSIRDDLEKLGVIFGDCDTGLRDHPEIFRKYFGTVIPANDNKFAALNSAVWSGGSFVYVPAGVHVDVPLQAYFRINSDNMGQFERTLIIAEEGSYVHYIEGCTAPNYSSDSLHSAVVEIIAHKDAHVRYTTIQNWSDNVYNLVTKRAIAYEGAKVEWIDGNVGCVVLGSVVSTPSGPKNIESLDIGDQVLSYDETVGELCFRRVTATRYSGLQPVHKVSVGSRTLEATANHPFLSYTYDDEAAKKLGRYDLAYVRTDHLTHAIVPRESLDYGMPHELLVPATITAFRTGNQYAKDLIVTRERPSRLAEISETTPDLMWLFGYWVGDGNIDIKPSATPGIARWAKVGFSTPSTNRAHSRLINTMTAVIDAEPTVRADDNHVLWNSTELADLFWLNDFRGNARTKRVPGWVWSIPQDQRLAFIAGYIDADGCVIRGRFQLKSVSKPLLKDFASILLTLGINSRLHTEFSDEREVEILGVKCIAHGSHHLVFDADPRLLGHVSESLRDRALAEAPTMRPHRKIARSNIELPESVEVVRVDVSPASEEKVPTFDIEVEGTGNFVCNGFIVHNSKITMKYPSIYLMGERAHGEILSAAFANSGQHQDAGSKCIHVAPNTTSNVVSRSISKGSGRTSYRGQIKVSPKAYNVKCNVRCDALLLDEESQSDTYPYMDIENQDVTIGHEASVSKVGEDQLFYLRSRGITENDATALIVNGFFEPFVKELPMEYAVELNRLLAMSMEGSVG